MRKRFLLPCFTLCLTPLAAIAQVPVPSPSEKAIAFHRELFWLWLLAQGMTFATLGGMVSTGWSSGVTRRATRWSHGRSWVIPLVTAAACAAPYALVSVPVEILRTRRLDPYLGKGSREVLPLLGEKLAEAGALALVLTAAGMLLHAIIRRSPRWWWLWVSGGVTLAASSYLLMQPLVDASQRAYPPIEVAQPSWVARLSELDRRAGATDVKVLVRPARAGEFCPTQSSAIGLGPTRAIVLAGAIFDEWTPGMVEASYAHELKHYLEDNTWLPVALLALLSVAGAAWIHKAGTRIARWRGQQLGFISLAAPAALPLTGLLLQAYLLIAVPTFHLVAQQRELDADRFALELTGDWFSRASVSAARCGDLWLPEDPLFDRLYLNTHPSTGRRVRLANAFGEAEASRNDQ